MKTEKPILLKAELICAVIAGLKTQTRRPVKSDKNPFGEVGGRIWVRETFRVLHVIEDGIGSGNFLAEVEYRCDGRKVTLPCPFDVCIGFLRGPEEGKWCPSLHMPRELCRLLLFVDDIRREPLQEITSDDIASEGVAGGRKSLMDLWNSIYSSPISWEDNPDVWALSFKVHEEKTN